ncbi:hypothetical protein ACVWYH_000042 [Bradyrhizobium sp. GM24.11]
MESWITLHWIKSRYRAIARCGSANAPEASCLHRSLCCCRRVYSEPHPRPRVTETSDSSSMPNFATSSRLSSVNAGMAMKIDMVKPMPARSPIRQTLPRHAGRQAAPARAHCDPGRTDYADGLPAHSASATARVRSSRHSLFNQRKILQPGPFHICVRAKVRRLFTSAGRMSIVGEDGRFHTEPVRRTGFAFADASN